MDPNSKMSPSNQAQIDAGQRQKSSQIGRSYTTAFREHGPDNKANRGLDTQAPMTGSEMTREDCDEQTGNFYNGNGAHDSYCEDGRGGEVKPKYKRQEFMRCVCEIQAICFCQLRSRVWYQQKCWYETIAEGLITSKSTHTQFKSCFFFSGRRSIKIWGKSTNNNWASPLTLSMSASRRCRAIHR